MPRPVLMVLVGAIGLIAVGLLLFRSDSGSPRVLRGYVPLGFQPTEVGRGLVRSSLLYLSGGGALTGIGLWEDEITVTSMNTPGAGEIEALSNVGLKPAAITSHSDVLLVGGFSPAIEGRVELPSDDCCAGLLVGTDNGVIVFPEEGGRSRSYLEYDEFRGSWREALLPGSVAVTSALFFDGFLYVGHAEGLLVVSPYDGCDDPVTMWDRPTSSLAVSHLDEIRPTIAAFDIQSQSMAMIDPGTTSYHEVTDCSNVELPELEAIVDIGDLGAPDYQPTLALIGTTAYVIGGDGNVYVVDVGSTEADLDRAIRLPGGPGAGASLVAVPDWAKNTWSVFVADPGGERLWWIATGGNESPGARIEPIRRSQQ